MPQKGNGRDKNLPGYWAPDGNMLGSTGNFGYMICRWSSALKNAYCWPEPVEWGNQTVLDAGASVYSEMPEFPGVPCYIPGTELYVAVDRKVTMTR
jgi:hypothetical protein